MNNSTNNKFNNPFIALRHKNFRYYWLGMCISLIGTWMQNIAQPWLAYTLTKSPFYLSLVGTLQFTPMLLFTLFAGVVIDKFPKKSLLLFTQTASMLITLVLAILVYSGHIQFWHILVMATLLGIVNVLDMPTRQAFVVELVGKEDLMNAIALNSTVFNLARIVGPALAGLVMGLWGIPSCFLINAISFGAVIIGLIFIKPLPIEKIKYTTDSIYLNIKDGLKYISHHKEILNTIILVGICGTFAINFNVLVPVLAKTVLHQNETGFGILMSFMGMGSFLGALAVASMSKTGPKKLILSIAPFIIAVFLVLMGFSDIYALSALGLALAGFTFVSFSSTANTLVQLKTKDEYRGRVMSLYTLVFAGTTPIGNILTGIVADKYGPKAGFIFDGAILLILLSALLVFKTLYKNDKNIDEI